MIMCYFCFLPTYVSDEETKVRNFDSHMQVEYGRASLKVAYRAENFVLYALRFQKTGVSHSLAGTTLNTNNECSKACLSDVTAYSLTFE